MGDHYRDQLRRDFGILANQLEGTLEVFQRQTEDILIQPIQIAAGRRRPPVGERGRHGDQGWELFLSTTAR